MTLLQSNASYLHWIIPIQNGLTAADIAKAGGHSDVYKELMVHATSQQVTRHTEDSVSHHCIFFQNSYKYFVCSNKILVAATVIISQYSSCTT